MMNNLLKRLLTGLLSLILLVTLGIYIVTLVVDPNQFRSNIETTSANVGVELGIEGDLTWQLFPLGISAEKVNFVLSDKSMAGSADQLSFGVNLSTIISLASQRSQFPISRLSITNGRVLYALPNSLPLQFSQINLAVDHLNSVGEKFPIALNVLAPKGIKISLDSEIAVQIQDQTVTDLSITNLQFKVNALSVSGYLEASKNLTKIQGNIKTEAFNLIKQFKLAKRFVPDLIVPQLVDANALTDITLDSFFDIETTRYSKIQTTLSIDGQVLDIDIDIDQQKYKLNTLVSGKVLNLDAYKAKSSANANNSMLFAPLAVPMALWHGKSQFELSLMTFNYGDISLSNLYANLFGNQNMFRLTAFSGDVFDGQINATASLNMQGPEPQFNAEYSMTDIDLSTVTKSMEDIKIGGKFNLETAIKGSGNTTESILESLDGWGEVKIENPSYIGFNLEQTLCNAAAIFGGKPIPKTTWSKNTVLDDLTGKLRFNEGRLLLSDYKTNLDHIDIYGNASLNLSTLRYSLNTTALATQSTSSAKGCKINPMIVKREIPFKCKGALGDKFKCKPDNNLIQTLLLSPKLQ